jgi:hypothetical protein
LDTLAGKTYLSFLNGFSGYNYIQISPEYQYKKKFTCPLGTYAYNILPFGLCNAPSTFQRVVLAIFFEKLLIRFQVTNLAFNDVKYRMLHNAGIFLGHFISSVRIQVDPTNIEVI